MNQPSWPDVRQLLPHRPPMLLVDCVLSMNTSSCTAFKHVREDEPCFLGHFPGNPIFPGVLTIEALAQVCAICLGQGKTGILPIFAGINRAKFRAMVRPGDRLELFVHKVCEENGFYTFSALAEVGGRTVCDAELVIVLKQP